MDVGPDQQPVQLLDLDVEGAGLDSGRHADVLALVGGEADDGFGPPGGLHTGAGAERNLVDHLLMEDPPQVLGIADHGPGDRGAVLAGCPEVPHHLDPELPVTLDGIREGLRLATGAHHQHVTAVVATRAEPVEGQACRQVSGDCCPGQDHEDGQQEQPADVQLDDVEEGHRREQHDDAGNHDVADLAAQRPAPAEGVEAEEPEHGDPHRRVQDRAKGGVHAQRLPQGGPGGIPEAELREEQEQRGSDECIRSDQRQLEREQVPPDQGRCPPRALATGAGTPAPWPNPG